MTSGDDAHTRKEVDPKTAATYADAVGPIFGLIGLAIVVSTFIYAIVLAVLAVADPSPAGAGKTGDAERAFLLVLSGCLFVVSLPVTWFAFRAQRFLLKHPALLAVMSGGCTRIGGIRLPGSGAPQALPLAPFQRSRMAAAELSPDDPAVQACDERASTWFRTGLIALSIAEAPSIFALVLALMLLFNADGLMAHPGVLGVCVVMAAISLAAKWAIRPTRNRLAAHLGATSEGEHLPAPADA